MGQWREVVVATVFFASLLLLTVDSLYSGGILKRSTSIEGLKFSMSNTVVSATLPVSPEFTPDVAAYFKRIKYSGPTNCNLETLKQIQWHHLKAFPFENLNIHLHRPIALDPNAIEEKIVRNGRGGYCFELNILLLHVLRALGYEVCPLVARVILQKRADQVAGLTHVVLRVEAEGASWLVDTGFGHFGPLAPLQICLDGISTESSGAHRMITNDNRNFIPQVMIHGEWVNMYRFLLDESYPSDWEMGSHYCSTHKDSKFVNNIIVSRFAEEHLLVLVNKDFSIRRHLADTSGEEILERREIQSEKELIEVLRDRFEIKLEEADRLCPPGSTWEEK